ncbi:hypothetical protein NKH77_50505 [Streptomyces sp. M19]
MQARYARQSRSTEAGAALARRMGREPGSGNFASILAELGKHANDPYFNAGFYNHLSGEQIRRLMSDPTGMKALVSAFASGAVTKETADRVTLRLGWNLPGMIPDLTLPWEKDADGVPPDDQLAFLKALLANRTAAANFAYGLDDTEVLRIKGTDGARTSSLGVLLDQVNATHPSWPRGAEAPTGADLSWELRGADNLPYPSVAPRAWTATASPTPATNSPC